MNNPTILFIRISESSFINNDIEFFKKKYPVKVYDFKLTKGPHFLLTIIKQLMWSVLNQYKYKIIYIWFADYHSFIPVMLSKIYRNKTIIIAGGYDADEILIEEPRGFKNKFRKFMVRFSFKNSTKVLAVSNCIFKYLENSSLTHNTAIVFNGVNINLFNINAYKHSKENLIITTGGSSSMKELKRKRLDFVVELGNEFIKLFPEYNAKFVLIGHNKDTETYNYLSNLIRNKNILLESKISDEKLSEYYMKSSVYLQPSYFEGFGIAIAEAMLNRCIALCNDGGSISEVIGEAGIIVKNFNKDIYLDSIKKILDKNYEYIREIAKDRVLKNYTLKIREKKILEELNDIVFLSLL